MKQLLARLGVGAATISAALKSPTVYPGATLMGEAIIYGGLVAQHIAQIYLYLRTSYAYQGRLHDHTLARYEIVDPFVIEAGQIVAVDLRLQLPYAVPLSMGFHPVWLQTGLDITWGRDPTDADVLQIEPTPLQQKFLDALRQLGFQLRAARTIYQPLTLDRSPLAQKFELRPLGAYNRLQALEVIFLCEPGQLGVLLEVRRRVQTLGPLLDGRAAFGPVELSYTDAELGDDWAPGLARVLDEIIQAWEAY